LFQHCTIRHSHIVPSTIAALTDDSPLMDAAGSNFSLKIVVKPLQTEAWLLPTDSLYRPIKRYRRRTPTLYRLATVNALQTDRRTTNDSL